eukprot:scaffold1884_cov109-Isochrysis_galbana.AAC.3
MSTDLGGSREQIEWLVAQLRIFEVSRAGRKAWKNFWHDRSSSSTVAPGAKRLPQFGPLAVGRGLGVDLLKVWTRLLRSRPRSSPGRKRCSPSRSSGGVPQADVLVCPEAVSRREYSEGGGLVRRGRAVSRALRLGGKGAILSSCSNQHCSSSLGPLFVLFGPGAGSVCQSPSGKKASQPGCPPKQGKECVQERSSALLFVELGADRNRAIPRADPRINLVTPTVHLSPIDTLGSSDHSFR